MLGDRIKEARKEAKMTLVGLAEEIGISKQALINLEKGKTKSTSSLLKISKILKVSPHWLETGVDEKEDTVVSLEREEITLIECYRKINRKDKAALLQLASSLARSTFTKNA